MDIPQRFCVRWNSYKSNLQTAFPKLLTSEHFVDVTLACEKQFIKCHKIVLSACSAYFETLLVNNPCQHPIIFMKDVQFWEIKALVEFMYKGEVNVSQNQLDSLLKSAESLQIRGLSGTKQFINFDQCDDIQDDSVEVKDECKIKKSKCDNEEVEEECLKKKKKKNDDDEKFIQITSVKGIEESLGDKKNENKLESLQLPQKSIKEETSEQEEFDFENNYSATGEEEEAETFSQDVFYPDHNNDPGPSGMSEFIPLDQLTVDDCYLDKEDQELETKSSLTNVKQASSFAGKSEVNCLKLKKPSARRNCYKQYTMASMWAALERIEQGLSVYRASLEYGVPRKTLRNWMKKYNILSYFDLRKQERERSDFCGRVRSENTKNTQALCEISDLCSLALNNVECVMDQEKTKAMSSSSSPPPPSNSSKNSFKTQQRHHEHNYTNPPMEDTSVTITKVNAGSEGSSTGERESPRVRSKAHKNETGENQRQTGIRPTSATPSERSVEVKNKVIKKDVFNRIRRSEEELQKAAEMVRGGMTFQTASDTFNIPISTIRFYMARRGILPQRRRGRGSSGVRDDDLIHPPFEIIHYRLPDIDKPI